jgi:8-oxo-dGTP pyrophosphatase MutT (NUDIX family)
MLTIKHHRMVSRMMSQTSDPNPSDELDDKTVLAYYPYAACLLLVRKDNLVLAVSRKNDHNDFGLPGGKVDPGESSYQALQREVWEETGIVLKSAMLSIPIFTALCPGPKEDRSKVHVNTCFISAQTVDDKPTQREGEGIVAWVSRQVLLEGSFGSYNKQVLDLFGLQDNTAKFIIKRV